MCGLTGFLTVTPNQASNDMLATLGRMADTLHHRGPDDTGLWCDPDHAIALGFKRLSILDLSSAGHQPMTSSSGRYVIAYNGEIYNHLDLRTELGAGHPFRGHSDTETLIEGFAKWGIEATLQRTIGMFALAVWDTRDHILTLARDRLGKKPLYFWHDRSTLLFASETKALRAHPAFDAKINRSQIGVFLKNSYLPTGSIYHNVVSVVPGSLVTIPLHDNDFWTGERFPTMKRYWGFRAAMTKGFELPFHGSYERAVDRLDQLLTDAVGQRMLSDVPLGAFLSGGIDSSLVVALMQKQSSRPVKTFTIGFEIEAYDEAPYAWRVAQHLGTEHTELYVTAKDALDVIPLLPTLFDEPFADPSQIPTYLVSKLARQHVTVALSGDGGDELFCGYRRYFEALDGFFSLPEGNPKRKGLATRLARLSRVMPGPVRRMMSGLLRSGRNLPWRKLARTCSISSDLFSDYGPHYRYLYNLSHWQTEDGAELDLAIPDTRSAARELCEWLEVPQTEASHFQQVWQAYDTVNYLPGDILTKIDRASMGVSLEARTPLLDHRVVEFAWTLPHVFQAQGRIGKRILRDVLARYVPRELFERPKAGFGVPIDAWLRGPLRDWAEDLLNEDRLRREGFFNPAPIRRKWREHLERKADWHYLLWDVLMFQSWLAKYPST